MKNIFKTTLIGLFFGTFGTTIGGIIGVKLKNKSNKFLSFILSLTSGLMISIVCFNLLPEAFKLTKLFPIIIGIIMGNVLMSLCEFFVDKKIKKLELKNNLLKTGIIVSIGLALHNFPEGLAIGSGFGSSLKLGISLAIAICLHDIPEGMSMAVPMKNGGIKTSKVIYYVFLSGITTGIGALIGGLLGEFSKNVIGICLGLAGGAMIYIVFGELIPQVNNLYKGKSSSIGGIIGVLIGILAMLI